MFVSRPDCLAGSPLTGSTLTGGTLVGGTTLRRPPYIKCGGTVTAGPLLGGPGGTTCPAHRGSFSLPVLICEKGSSPRRDWILFGLRPGSSSPPRRLFPLARPLCGWERAGVRGAFLRGFLGETTCPVPSVSIPTGGRKGTAYCVRGSSGHLSRPILPRPSASRLGEGRGEGDLCPVRSHSTLDFGPWTLDSVGPNRRPPRAPRALAPNPLSPFSHKNSVRPRSVF